ncbi:hypothetical protein B0H17DRAFT_1327498 [Mycena rosella]|uniref:Uncharacterized protein n=1 Tax=Mycena rosella TaxID=1033263 RepID=A0AAD7GPT6_MYCRO|nr:hypothetical protein B0H17DRAFT_1327498 [Mycena rosella]
MYPDGRTNPTPAHFARNTPVEFRPPVSPRLLHQRQLDREGRAICRIVYAHGLGAQSIARVFCVSEDKVIQAIQNESSHQLHDTEEHDYFYVSKEYRDQYPSLAKPVEQRSSNTNTKKARSSGGAQPKAHPLGRLASGAGNNPTCRNFRESIPVVGTDYSNSHLVKLDRKGRAICRIVYLYIKSYTKIGLIFGITHTRARKAVLNDYAPPDDLAEDYAQAGHEFKDEYPPLSDKRPSDSRKRQRSHDASPELDDVPGKRVAKMGTDVTSQPAPKAVRMIPVVELPAPKADPGAAGIRSFLKNVGGFDLSTWQETFKEKGLCTMGDLATLACLEEGRLVKTLTRLFSDRKMAEVHILLLADALLDLARDVE